ncbi:MAG: TetR/AcrR family transcriptional regulator [Gemmatimonadales bacterium]
MGRPKAFDEDAALDRAAELFWTQGYEATSISDLEERLGVGRQSLYDTFGDKRRLFLRAIERYTEWNRDGLVGGLLDPDAGMGAVRDYFRALAIGLTNSTPRRACLIANSLLEIGCEDREVLSRCQKGQRAMHRGFEHALGHAVAAGELPRDLDVSLTARLLTSQVYGMSVLSQAGASASELRQLAEGLLNHLG